MDSKAVLAAVLPVYLLILAGAALRKLGVLKKEQDEPIFHLVFSILYPCFILDKMLGSESVRHWTPVVWGLGVGFGITVISFAVTWLAAGLMGFQKGGGRRTFTLTAGVQNFGYTAVPVVEQIWTKAALPMLFVHNFGVEFAIWSVGVMILSAEKKVQWRKLVNGPVIALLLGLILVGTRVDRFLPAEILDLKEINLHDGTLWMGGIIRKTIAWLGGGAFPVAILVTGAVMSDMIGHERPSPYVMIAGCVTRLAFLPCLLLAAAKYLPAPVDLKQVLIVQAAMPSAMTPIMLARIYGGRPAIAAQIVIATTVVSICTVPLVIVWGRQWVGL